MYDPGGVLEDVFDSSRSVRQPCCNSRTIGGIERSDDRDGNPVSAFDGDC